MTMAEHEKYQRLIEAAKSLKPVTTAVAHPCDESSLAGAVDAAKLGLIAPILVGPKAKIEATAVQFNLDISRYEQVDRFRFDSFAPESDENRRLLARLGRPSLIHYLFMITPPHQTVERAWRRGLETGRFKAVDDLLAHNVEAYAGMRDFFFARALHPTLAVHYEFLDNDVPQGSVPLTAAFGWNGDLNILDVTCMLNLDRRGPRIGS